MRAGIGVFVFLLISLISGFYAHQTEAAAGCGYNSHNDYICPGQVGAFPNDPFNTGVDIPRTSNSIGTIWSGGGIVNNPGSGGSSSPVSEPIPCDLAGDPYAQFLDHLKAREGVVNCVYRDSLGFPTVGVGHLVLPADGLSVGDCISDAQVDAFLQADAAKAWSAANSQASSVAGGSSPCFAVALGAVNYQLGTGWTSKFPNTWSLIQSEQYCEAANALEGTLWNRQTPVRVDDFQVALREEAASKGITC
ncbi:MAG: hypothetical protein CO093_07225 [Alphaproteobacteria bacterium CG_4_9_14_3_um_filter_47_13]|nr:MAG: hypothetical protein CO093_07225 [Alphaproteobacteria bacterium CG_4_9_14_3_um_filter_47_13]